MKLYFKNEKPKKKTDMMILIIGIVSVILIGVGYAANLNSVGRATMNSVYTIPKE